MTVAFGMCGSFCTHQQALQQMEKLAETGAPGARIEMEVNPANMI